MKKDYTSEGDDSHRDTKASGTAEFPAHTNRFVRADLTGKVISAAIEVHKALGPGFLESTYEEALCIELLESSVPFERQKLITIFHRGIRVGEHRLDLLVEGRLVVELKACASLERIHFAVVRSYMKAVGTDLGLIINFSSMPLTIKRVAPEREERRKVGSGNQEEQTGTHE